MGEAGAARLLVLAADVVLQVDGHDRRAIVVGKEHAQAVIEPMSLDRDVGQNVLWLGDGLGRAEGYHEPSSGLVKGALVEPDLEAGTQRAIGVIAMVRPRGPAAHRAGSPLAESVPPHMYGGTERIVSYLTEESFDRSIASRCMPAVTR